MFNSLITKYKALPKSTKNLIEIGLLMSGVGVMYFVLKDRFFLRIISVDKDNRKVTYKWQGEEYTWDWSDQQDEYEVYEENGDHYIITRKVQNPPSVEIVYMQTKRYQRGVVIEDQVAVEKVSFT
jgi:hypothetical protein